MSSCQYHESMSLAKVKVWQKVPKGQSFANGKYKSKVSKRYLMVQFNQNVPKGRSYVIVLYMCENLAITLIIIKDEFMGELYYMIENTPIIDLSNKYEEWVRFCHIFKILNMGEFFTVLLNMNYG